MLLGLVGKTNVGKSTFFAASTMLDVEVANRPFTTIKPNHGVAYIRSQCVCSDFSVKDAKCVNGTRFVPVELLDVAGLVPGAHLGRGLGNKFLDDLRQADVFIHVVDASGSTDPQGRFVGPGSYDPVDEVQFLRNELDFWLLDILGRDWEKTAKLATLKSLDATSVVHGRLSGLGFQRDAVEKALIDVGLESKNLDAWNEERMLRLAKRLREVGKPSVVAANKADLPHSMENIDRMRGAIEEAVIPVVAEAELALRKAQSLGIIKYIPGDLGFQIVTQDLSYERAEALRKIEKLMGRIGGTGVQQALDAAVYQAYGGIVVYPVEDLNKLSDKSGVVLPDAHIVKQGSTPKDLARIVHTELAEKYDYAIDARTKQRLASDHILKDRDVVKIIAD